MAPQIWIRKGPDLWGLLIKGLAEGELIAFGFAQPIDEVFRIKKDLGWAGKEVWLRTKVVGMSREYDKLGQTKYWIVETRLEYDTAPLRDTKKILFVNLRYDPEERKGVVVYFENHRRIHQSDIITLP